MTIFKSFTLTWWQGSMFKLSVFALGIAAGAYWPGFFAPFIIPLVVLGLIGSLYLGVIWAKQ